MEQQIRETFLRAWRDVMEAKMREDPPDYDWVDRSYLEVRGKLLRLTRENSPTRRLIEEKMDPTLFGQMIRHGAFQGPEFLALVHFTFDTCLALGAPADDDATRAQKETVLRALQSGAVFAQLIPIYFENANICVDRITGRLGANM